MAPEAKRQREIKKKKRRPVKEHEGTREEQERFVVVQPFDVESGEEGESDEEEERNRIGNVPLEWYKDFDHTGYDISGKKVLKTLDESEISKLLASADDPDNWRRLSDVKNQRSVLLSGTDIEIIRRIRSGQFPNASYDPYGPDSHIELPHEDWMHPVPSGTPPKRRFLPSKWESIRINKLVKAIREGRIRPPALPPPSVFDIWGASITDDMDGSNQKKRGPPPLFAPRLPLPGHSASYNPPSEYLFTPEEEKEWEEQDAEDREVDFIPQQYSALRKVPAYRNAILERFQRCLDLYLCPRATRRRWNVDPDSLLPELPKPRDLRPFPQRIALDFQFFEGASARGVSVDSTGDYLAVASESGQLSIYDITTSRQVRQYVFQRTLSCVSFHPSLPILGFALEEDLYLVLVDLPAYRTEVPIVDDDDDDEAGRENTSKINHSEEEEEDEKEKEDDEEEEDDDDDNDQEKKTSGLTSFASRLSRILRSKHKGKALAVADQLLSSSLEPEDPTSSGSLQWVDLTGQMDGEEDPVARAVRERRGFLRGFRIRHAAPIGSLAWHSRGLYFASVCPTSGVPRDQCSIHSLLKRKSLRPLRKGGGGRVMRVAFHPFQPSFFVVSNNCIRVFDLTAKKSAKKDPSRPSVGANVRKLTGFDGATCISIHPDGDHVIVGSEKKVLWFDLELKSSPYKCLTTHDRATRDVGFHPVLPLAFTSSTDGSAHVLHARVYKDYTTNPLIVPLITLKPQNDPLLKALTPEGVDSRRSALTCACWHPRQPWLFTASAGGIVTMWA